MSTYIYKGDKLTDPNFTGKVCTAIRRADGKCIRGKNSNMLVSFEGVPVVVMARRLKKLSAD